VIEMHVVVASSAFDVLFLQRKSRMCLSATPRFRTVAQAIGLVSQGVAFAATVWLLVAAPGFLSARDSQVRAASVPMTHQTSR